MKSLFLTGYGSRGCGNLPRTKRRYSLPAEGSISTAMIVRDDGGTPHHSSFVLTVLGTSDSKVRTTSIIPSIVSFIVIPESPVGMIAIIASSLAALGGFVLIRRRNKNNEVDGFLGSLGIS